MKKSIRIWIVTAVVLATVFAVIAWRWHSSTLRFRNEVKCRLGVRGPIGQAKLSYATWKRLAKGRSVTKQEIASYFEGDRLPSCPSGGKISIGSIGEPVRCSLGAHARPACNDHYNVDPLVDMKYGWWMGIKGTSKGVMMNLSGVRIILSDLQWEHGGGLSSITIGGSGTSRSSGRSTVGDISYDKTVTYSNGVTTITLDEYEFQLTDNATRIVFSETVFRIGTNRPTLLVNKDIGVKSVRTWQDLDD